MKAKRQHYSCLRCSWNGSSNGFRYDGAMCPRCGQPIMPVMASGGKNDG